MLYVYEYAVATTNDDCVDDILLNRKFINAFNNIREVVMYYRNKFDNRTLQLSTNVIDECDDYTTTDKNFTIDQIVYTITDDNGQGMVTDDAPDGLLVIIDTEV